MKTVTISSRSKAIKGLLDLAKQEDLVLRTPDGDEFMLSVIDDFEHETAQQRRSKKLMAFLDKRFREARQEKGIPLKEVERQLGLNSHVAKVPRPQTGPRSR